MGRVNGGVTTTFVAPPAAATAITPLRPRVHRDSPWRQRAALAVLLVATAVMYLWNITINGMGNQFYAGAAWAGSKNWEALLFGSLDPGNFITVDKPPVSQWVMGLSGQIFGFSSASMLIPQALMAVAAVALLYGAVRRVTGPHTGLLAGAALALTPVAALMFRFNNPDAAMVLLMMAAAYATVRALERPRDVDSAGRRGTGLRVPGEDARRPDGAARAGAGLSDRRAQPGAPASRTCSARWSRSSCRRVGLCWSRCCGRPRPGPTWPARPTTTS